MADKLAKKIDTTREKMLAACIARRDFETWVRSDGAEYLDYLERWREALAAMRVSVGDVNAVWGIVSNLTEYTDLAPEEVCDIAMLMVRDE